MDAAGSTSFFSNPESWYLITWVIVVVALFRPVWRNLTGALDSRRDRIKKRIEEAERLRAEAQELLAAMQKRQRDAKKDAEDIVAHARIEAQRIATQAAKDIEDLLTRRQRQAEDRIAQAEADAVRQVRAAAVDIAVAAASKLIAENLTPAQAGALVDKQLQEIPARLH